jgi:hypothetical protein
MIMSEVYNDKLKRGFKEALKKRWKY